MRSDGNAHDCLRIVLSLVNPEEYQDSQVLAQGDRNDEMLRSAFQYAKKNGLGYVFLERTESLGTTFRDVSRKELEREKEKITEIRSTISLLNDISETHSIDYVTIKWPYLIPHIPRDIDIFVPYESREPMIRSLISSGMRMEHSSSAETTLTGKGHSKVDIYSRICYFNYDFLDDEFFQNSRESCTLFDIESVGLTRDASFTLGLLHSLFGNRSITLLDLLDLQQLMESVESIETCRSVALEHGWEEIFDIAVSNLKDVQERIRNEDSTIDFPYPFDKKLIFECLSTIDGLNLNARQRAMIGVSLFVDDLVFQSKEIGLYEALRANRSLRRLINSVAHSIRLARGDRKVT